ncbi:MAG: heme lyase CcmF/NrfE family subunit [Hahellaceae bacterium]|nr:heme lyase CcmF/NrfE family subunit [Hahellaceae bacterium]
MLPELGHWALILAFGIAILLATVPLIGAWLGDRLWMGVARPFAVAQMLMISAAFAALSLSFLTDDFSVKYVAGNSNTLLPWYYKLSAVWGGHEGSLLLWALILSGWTLAVALLSRSLPEEMVARVLGVMGIVNVGFLSFILFTSNPFLRLLTNTPTDGGDLNPLLQDIGLIMHPPLLYMGYVGFSVAFAFAIAALLGGQLDAAWARWSRPWTTVAWAFLTVGIALGSWWAYYELGWGGWWFWDPVENASLMPWLAGTALMHSLAVTEKRGLFKSWTVLLAIFAFSLSLLGTFLVRSGILTSVHAFAADPARGEFVLMLLLITIGGSLTLYALRAPAVKSRISFSERSRETFMLVNNIILVVATLTVLGGTLFPLAAEYFGKEVSVGAPYFNLMFMVLAPALVIFLGVGLSSQWKDTRPGVLLKQVPLLAVVSVPVAFVIPLWMGELTFSAVLGMFLASWLIMATVRDVQHKCGSRGWRVGWLKTTRSFKGMVLGHLGLAVLIIGATLVSNYTVEKDVRMTPGDAHTLGDWVFRFDKMDHLQGPNYLSDQGHFTVETTEGKVVGQLHPEKRRYVVSGNMMTEAGIMAGLWRDLYISLGEKLPGDEVWAVRLHVKPFVRWLWLGGLLMALGGTLAVMDKRYRFRRSKPAPQPEVSSSDASSAALPGETS